MIKFVSQFTAQLEEAFDIGKKSNLTKSNKKLSNAIICGLGGSGIGGKIASQLIEKTSPLPVIIHNSYSLPKFVDENTLVIISSYSGNTEETLSALKEAQKRNSEIACITSGGEIGEIAKKNNYNSIFVPGGNPPRSMLSFSLTQLFFILNNYNLLENDFENDLKSSITLLNNEIEAIKTEAKQVVETIKNTTTLIYTDESFEGVGTRFKQQLNENAKVLAFNHVVPEMNHNELVGWAGGDGSFSAVFIRNESDYNRNQVRMDVCKGIISEKTKNVVEIFSKGENDIEKTLYLILLTDWVSVYLAEVYKVDSIEVNVINIIKDKLSNL